MTLSTGTHGMGAFGLLCQLRGHHHTENRKALRSLRGGHHSTVAEAPEFGAKNRKQNTTNRSVVFLSNGVPKPPIVSSKDFERRLANGCRFSLLLGHINFFPKYLYAVGRDI